jgi:general secretion pathway protein G
MKTDHAGFNVLELTATLALLGVLAAMAIPAFNGYTERVRVNRAIGEISRVSMELYRWRLNVGDGSFPATLNATGIGVNEDPWGFEYVYTRVEGAAQADLRKDKNLNPVNTDFDFYSIGPDGSSARPFNARPARDDIVRANDGAFVGLAAQY